MGFGGISIWQLLIILLIVVLLFGTGKLKSLGSDLGSALRNFRSGVKDAGDADDASKPDDDAPPR
jgi:sec-independent protein translocase protein TatA